MRRSTPHARAIAITFGVGAGAVFVGSLLWAWATADFWEDAPLLSCVAAAGLLAALAAYVSTRNTLLAVVLGLSLGLATFLGTLIVTLSRWEG